MGRKVSLASRVGTFSKTFSTVLWLMSPRAGRLFARFNWSQTRAILKGRGKYKLTDRVSDVVACQNTARIQNLEIVGLEKPGTLPISSSMSSHTHNMYID